MRDNNISGRLNIMHGAAIVFCFIAVTHGASTLLYTGVNLTGPEWTGSTSGPFWPNTYEIDYFISRGMNIFRLPFAWELMQPSLNGALNQAFLNRYKDLVNYITITKQLSVIIDPHNYARYNNVIASSSALADLWTKLANQFKTNSRVIFGIMNEPNTMSTVTWRNTANAALAAIRATGATNLILVPGNGWTAAGSWTDTWYDTASPQVSNAVAMLSITDSMNNYAFELHTYFDTDSSGTHVECVPPPTVPSHLQVITNWLKTNNKRGFLGEFGGSGQTNCVKAFNDSLNYLEANNDVWLGWTYWGAGPRFGSAFLTVEPTGYPPKPNSKLTAIKPHMKGPIVPLVYPTIPSCSAADHYIFDDQLQNGWQDWSWATHSLTSTNSMSGNAVSFIPSGNAAFWVSRPNGQNFSIANYNAIQFGIAGDAPGNQAIDVSFWVSGGTPHGASTPPIDFLVNRSITTSFKVATIPFAVLDIPADKFITGVSWQDASGDQQSTVYLDNIKFVCRQIPGGTLSSN
jgi:endoglucanase